MHCVQCGEPLPDGALFCGVCGSAVLPLAPSTKKAAAPHAVTLSPTQGISASSLASADVAFWEAASGAMPRAAIAASVAAAQSGQATQPVPEKSSALPRPASGLAPASAHPTARDALGLPSMDSDPGMAVSSAAILAAKAVDAESTPRRETLSTVSDSLAEAAPNEPPTAEDADAPSLPPVTANASAMTPSLLDLVRPRRARRRLHTSLIVAFNLALLAGAGFYFSRYLELRAAYAQIAAAVTLSAPQPGTPADDADVQRVVLLHMSELQDCYSLRLAGSPTLAGQVTVSFTIETDGKAAQVQVLNNQTGSDPLAACLVEHIASWPFPKTAAGKAFTRTFNMKTG